MHYLFLQVAVLLVASNTAVALEYRGNVSSEFTYFPESSVGTDNFNFSTSFAADVELSHDFADNVRLTVQPFARWDENDGERTHADFRELLLSTTGDTWEFNAGIGTVFWGVTESENPVDIINQTDLVEETTGDDKLGQLMLNLNWFTDNYGDFEAYLLPKSRERTFAGINGRPFAGIIVDPDLTTYESGDGDEHISYALRWTRSFDTWDVGLHLFDGTARDPLLIPTLTGTSAVLAPRYPEISQVGIDALGLFGDLAAKAEVIYQTGDEIDSHAQSVTGIEYTLVGFLSPLQENDKLPAEWCSPDTRNPFKRLACNDRIDLGLVVEYLFDQRGRTTAAQPFQNDLLAGLRFAFNDAASSDALLGLVQDLDGGATTLSLEASTRLFASYRLTILGQSFINTDGDSVFNVFENESFIQLDFSYFF